MNTMIKVLKYQARDAIRSRWLIAYALFFLLVTDALLRFTGDPVKAAAQPRERRSLSSYHSSRSSSVPYISTTRASSSS